MTTPDDSELSMSEAIAAFTGSTGDTANEANSDDNQDAESDVGADDGHTEPEDDLDSESADDSEEDEGEPDEDGQPDEDEEDDEQEAGQGRFASDDHRVKLPDGTFATVAELKAGNLRDRDYRQKTMEVAEERKSLTAKSEAFTQRESQVQQQLEYTQELLQSLAPQAPDPAMMRTDPMGYLEAKDNYERFSQHLTYIQSTLDGRKTETQDKAAGDRSERAESAWNELVKAAPELTDEKNVKALISDFQTFGTEYGFSPQELGEIPLDHRQVLVLRKAIAWDKLQAKNKAKQPVVNSEKRPPVQKGGKRLNGGDIKARERNAAMERLNKTGSVRDGVAAYLASQS